uniref:Uncharacterized protein n=1 Tax=Mycena chlorophos TaxID=658473 RepID=A0ABQ0LLM8_MYCCL|nr:predicted protein [Mycena chlorophos]
MPGTQTKNPKLVLPRCLSRGSPGGPTPLSASETPFNFAPPEPPAKEPYDTRNAIPRLSQWQRIVNPRPSLVSQLDDRDPLSASEATLDAETRDALAKTPG